MKASAHKKATFRGLFISMREGEQVSISNGEILVEVVESRGGWVRLAFKAAKDIKIERKKNSLADPQTNDDSKWNR